LKGCDWVTPGQPSSPDACQDLFKGKVASGEACRSTLECAGNHHCAGASPNRGGRCTPPQPLDAVCGTHLDNLVAYTFQRDLGKSHPFCADFCALTTHRCEPVPTNGSTCHGPANCASGHTCVDGKCSTLPRARVGEPCDKTPCEVNARCVSGTCRALGQAGDSCTSDFECAKGGCVKSGDAGMVCGKKCAMSLEKPGKVAGLPMRPRAPGPAPSGSARTPPR
jgi:hypothetical protein